MNVYIPKLGVRHAIHDFDQIKWFLDYQAKRGNITAMLLDIHEQYFMDLFRKECYEMIDYLHQSLTKKQVVNRAKWRMKQQEAKEEHWKEMLEWHERYRAKQQLIGDINPN